MKDMQQTNRELVLFNLIFTYFILVFGLIGNILAFIFNLKIYQNIGNRIAKRTGQKHNLIRLNYILFGAFYIFSILVLCMQIPLPLIRTRVLGLCCKTVWNSYQWLYYLSYVQFPLSKFLISFTFSIVMLTFIIQLMVVVYPFRIEALLKTKYLIGFIGTSAIYHALWYAPTTLWFYVDTFTITPNTTTISAYYDRAIPLRIIDNTSLPYTIYVQEIFIPGRARLLNLWVAYHVVRELVVNIIPMSIIISIKCYVVHRRRKRIIPQQRTQLFLTEHSQAIRQIDSDTMVKNQSVKEIPSNNTISTARKQFKVFHYPSQKYRGRQNREKFTNLAYAQEMKQHNITIYVLLIEFFIFRLPICIIDMLIDNLLYIITEDVVNDLYVFLTLLQYLFFASTFYINFMCNKIYRRDVLDCCKYFLFCNPHQS